MKSERQSVLFLLGRFTVGGVERVTVTMANEFASRDWRVCVAAFEFVRRDLLDGLDGRVAVEELGFPAFRLASVRKLKAIMHKNGTYYIINQWALPFPVTAMLHMAKPAGAKIIAFHHTMPNRNGRLQVAKGFKRWFAELASRASLRLVYRCSDAYVVLSPSLMPVFQAFTGIRNARKLSWLPNPLSTLPSQEEKPHKDNAILFVGRLSQFEKRVDRVLDVWRMLSQKLPGWRLDIVGDGPDRSMLESCAKDISRVTFHGFKEATPYFSRSKILLLTSDFEGFPMVLVEAMANGCVPVAYGSFPTVRDIIHGDDGFVVPEPWNVKTFAAKVALLANNEVLRKDMARTARKSVTAFSMENVLRQYLELFESLV